VIRRRRRKRGAAGVEGVGNGEGQLTRESGGASWAPPAKNEFCAF